MSDELYKAYRPRNLDQVIGNEAAVNAVRVLLAKGKVPHSILLCGPSGCGKTTIGRILAAELGCHESEFTEVDSGQFRGVDTARDLREQMMYAPQRGKVRVWLIDEAHQQTKDQQNAMLKALEDTPSHVYFMLATTDPDKLLKAIQTRCTRIEVAPLSGELIAKKVLWPVCQAEKTAVDKSVLLYIGNNCGGSCRAALVMLGAVIDLPSKEEQLNAVKGMTLDEEQVSNLANLLLKAAPYTAIVAALKGIPSGTEESTRRGVLGYMAACAVGWGVNNKQLLQRVARVMVAFEKPYYDTGRSGLILSCMDACGLVP